MSVDPHGFVTERATMYYIIIIKYKFIWMGDNVWSSIRAILASVIENIKLFIVTEP